jgi:choline dehydrogenase-like flavoprotein
MDHHLDVGAAALVDGFEDRYYLGNRPNDLYIPRYRNLGSERRDYIRGFGYQGNASRLGWTRLLMDATFGGDVKTQAATPGTWYIKLGGFGEILPNHANRVTLDRTRKDKWGLPLLAFDAQLRENELKMRKEMASDAAEMLEAAGFTDVRTYDREIGVGLGIHEMGTARMGKDPKTSVLNKWNQVHACPNVYVTDGSFMVSSACQNPSLTYMAMTARAVDHAVATLNGRSVE